MARRLDILYVEDDPHMIRLVDEAFAESPVPTRVHGVTDGAAARTVLGDETPAADRVTPDLVLLDNDLGAESGLDLLDVLPGYLPSEVSLVVFTSSDDPEAVDLAYERGANAFVQKPGDFEGLVRFAHRAATFWNPVPASQASA